MSKYTIKDWMQGRVGVKIGGWYDFYRLMDIAEKNGVRWYNGKEANQEVIAEVQGVIRCWVYSRLEPRPEYRMDYDEDGPIDTDVTLDEMEIGEKIDLEDVPTAELVAELIARQGVNMLVLDTVTVLTIEKGAAT